MQWTSKHYGFAGAIIGSLILAGGGWITTRWDHDRKLQEELDRTKADLTKSKSDLKTAQDTIIALRKRGATQQPGANREAGLDGTYEWQWADASWRGYLTVKNGAVMVEMNQKRDCPDKTRQVPIIRQGPSGTMERLKGSDKVRVNMPVTFVRYTKDCTAQDDPGPTTLEGDLTPYRTYAGTLTYRGPDGKTSRGDIVLVKDWVSGIHYSAMHKSSQHGLVSARTVGPQRRLETRRPSGL